LNLGHTFGHASERASGYRVSHGAGVAVGLRAAGLLAMRLGRFSEDGHLRVLALLALLKLPMRTRELPANVLDAMSADKKRRNGTLRFVLPNTIGDVEYGIEARPDEVRRVLKQCTQVPGAREFR
ncbi:MAG: 3-dehydroquinate synthase family protein, partial [Rhodanobacteraceae bacterium]